MGSGWAWNRGENRLDSKVVTCGFAELKAAARSQGSSRFVADELSEQPARSRLVRPPETQRQLQTDLGVGITHGHGRHCR